MLAIIINETRDMKGIVIGQAGHKISHVADNTEWPQDGDRKTFDDFGNKSGMKINIEKNNNSMVGITQQ